MENILYINSCVRDESRTQILAEYVLSKLDGKVTKLNLEKEHLEPLNKNTLAYRNRIMFQKKLNHPVFKYARQFAEADTIVIAAPFWDLSFPAMLKTYIEHINILGITFSYTEEGIPQGLCNAKKLIYITTSGGPIISEEFGFGYIKKLCNMFYGISDTLFIKAENLDIIGNDVNQILSNTKEEIDSIFSDLA